MSSRRARALALGRRAAVLGVQLSRADDAGLRRADLPERRPEDALVLGILDARAHGRTGRRPGAQDALELIALDIDDLPVHLATAEGGPQIHPEAPGNVGYDWAFGDEAERLAAALPGAHVDGDLTAAVADAAEMAEPGDVVLLSPACASFDQFANFEARGDAFRQLVAQLGPHA